MIISCEKCAKKFNINSDLIPEKGRLLQCSSCEHKWFFKRIQIEEKTLLFDEIITNKKEEKSSINNKNVYLGIDFILLLKVLLTCQNLLRKETENAQGNCLVEIDGVSAHHTPRDILYYTSCSFTCTSGFASEQVQTKKDKKYLLKK